jgi:hypothetical protein
MRLGVQAMNTFKSGDRVEVIASDAHYTAGQQGTVKGASRDLVFVVLDKQPQLPRGSVVIDVVGDKTRVACTFRASEFRHVITPTA